MNGDQRSVTVAFLLVAASLAVRHHWASRFTTWLGNPPKTGIQAPTSQIVPIGSLNDWQAAIIAYGVLFVLADTQAAPVTSPLAWAVGLVSLFGAVGILAKEYPATFGGGNPAQGAQGASNGAQGVQTPAPGASSQLQPAGG